MSVQFGLLVSPWFYCVLGAVAGVISWLVRRRFGHQPLVLAVVAGYAIVGAIAATNSLGLSQLSKCLALVAVFALAMHGAQAFKGLQRGLTAPPPQ